MDRPYVLPCAPIAGGRLAYEVSGDGPALILIHGSLLDRRLWDAQVPVLAQRHRVVRYDARGHGASSSAAMPFAHERDLHDLMQALRLDRATLIGLSMGGRIALQFTLTYPERVAALVIVASGMDDYTYEPEVHACRATMSTAIEERGAIAEATDAFLRTWVIGPRRTPEQVSAAVLKAARRMVERSLSQPSLDDLEEPFSPSIRSRLRELQAPALVMVGEHDLPDMLMIADQLAAGLPGAEQVLVPGAGHLVNLEQPDVFNSTVSAFLANHGDRLPRDRREGGDDA